MKVEINLFHFRKFITRSLIISLYYNFFSSNCFFCRQFRKVFFLFFEYVWYLKREVIISDSSTNVYNSFTDLDKALTLQAWKSSRSSLLVFHSLQIYVYIYIYIDYCFFLQNLFSPQIWLFKFLINNLVSFFTEI